MEGTRTTWTDERLDDLNRHVEGGFARLDADIRALRADLSGRMDAQSGETAGRFDTVDSRVDAHARETARRFDHLEARIDALQRTLIQTTGAMMTGILATLVTVILTRGG
jgi:hypothetical protein